MSGLHVLAQRPVLGAAPKAARLLFQPAVGGQRSALLEEGYTGPIPPRGAADAPQQRLRRMLLRGIGRLYGRPTAPVAPRSLLLIRPDHLGDMLFVTPALHQLRRALPAAHITLLAGPWSGGIVAGNPDLDAVLACPFPGFERRAKTSPWAPYRLLAAQARTLRGRGYDAAVILRFDHWWGAWLAAAAGIPRRIGYDRPETRPFLTHALPYVAGRHEVEQNAALLDVLAGGLARPLGPTRFRITAADRAWAAAWLAAAGSRAGERLVALHPGAGAAVKQWPAPGWAAVANALAGQHGVRILLTGGGGERDLTAGIAAQLAQPALDATGQTTLGQLAALYERCVLVLGVDSGPLHLAVAAGAGTVHLYGPVAAAEFGPWGDPARNVVLPTPWACAPCHRLDWPADSLAQHACVAAIRPEAVLAAAVQVLDDRSRLQPRQGAIA